MQIVFTLDVGIHAFEKSVHACHLTLGDQLDAVAVFDELHRLPGLELEGLAGLRGDYHLEFRRYSHDFHRSPLLMPVP
jgi:hypothetical protein